MSSRALWCEALDGHALPRAGREPLVDNRGCRVYRTIMFYLLFPRLVLIIMYVSGRRKVAKRGEAGTYRTFPTSP